jgi:hypothetical protein
MMSCQSVTNKHQVLADKKRIKKEAQEMIS